MGSLNNAIGAYKNGVEGSVQEIRSANQEDLVALLVEPTEWHPVFLEEPDELFLGDAAILTAGDTIALEPSSVEPFRHRTWGDLTNLGHLSGGEHLFHGTPCDANVSRGQSNRDRGRGGETQAGENQMRSRLALSALPFLPLHWLP